MSYTWRSILAGLQLLKKGIIWRVGAGTTIRIWEDGWLPRDESRRPFTPKGLNLLTRVNELIDPINGSWDEALIRDIFWEEDADCILCIPIHEGMDDLIAWHFNKNGQFSVRSAYKVFMSDKRSNTRNRGGGESSSGTASQVPDPLWKTMWNLSCPKKMIHFLWRLGHNTLALRVNLRKRGMKIETKCVMFERFDEDGAHFFFKCKGVRQIWAILQLEPIRETLAELLSVREMVEAIVKMKPDIQRRVITLLYLWWSERCGVREGEQARSSERLAQVIFSYAAEWSNIKQMRDVGNQRNNPKS